MSTATSSLRYLLARAAIRADARMHIVSERDSSLLNPICAAHPIRSAKIDTWETAPADLTALCPDCAALAASIPGISSIDVGLAVFLGGTTDGSPLALLTEVPIAAIDLAPDHARRTPGDVDSLIASITERGVVVPVVLRRTGNRFEVIDGARRLYAVHKAGRTTVPAIVRDATDSEALLDGLVANLHRADLNLIDQALAYQRALDVLELSQAQLAQRLAISAPHLSNTLRLLALPEQVQDQIASGAVGAAHARELLRMEDPADQIALAAQIAAEGLTVRQTAERRAAPGPATEKLGDVAQLLAGLLAARVLVTTKGNRARITIDVPESDLARVLEQVGGAAALAA